MNQNINLLYSNYFPSPIFKIIFIAYLASVSNDKNFEHITSLADLVWPPKPKKILVIIFKATHSKSALNFLSKVSYFPILKRIFYCIFGICEQWSGFWAYNLCKISLAHLLWPPKQWKILFIIFKAKCGNSALNFFIKSILFSHFWKDFYSIFSICKQWSIFWAYNLCKTSLADLLWPPKPWKILVIIFKAKCGDLALNFLPKLSNFPILLKFFVT